MALPSESDARHQTKKRFWLRFGLAGSLVGAGALTLLISEFLLEPPPEVPVPGDLAKLDPQLCAYVTAEIERVRDSPRDVGAHARLGMVYAANSLWREARMAFQNAAQLDPKEPLARLYVAISTQELGDFDEALKLFRQITSEFPQFGPGYYRVGDALLRAGMVNEAEAAFQQLISLAPQEWRGYAGLGEAKIRKGDWPGAATLLEKAIALDPDAKAAHHLLGQAYRGLGRFEDARLHLALGLNQTRYPMDDAWSVTAPQHMKLLQDQIDMAVEYSARGRPAKAVEILKEALAYQPLNVSLANALAIAYNRAGQPAKARDLLSGIIQKDDHYFAGYITLSHSSADLGLTNEALRYAERAVELAPQVAQPHLAKANALLAMERDEEAYSAMEAASRCDPQNPEIQLEMGDLCLLNLQRTQQAAQYYNEAIELSPAFAPAYVRLAELYLGLGHGKQAASAIETLRKLSPRTPELAGLEARLRKTGRPANPK